MENVKETIEELLDALTMAKEFKPVVEKGMVALKEYTPYLRELCESLADFGVEQTDRSIKKFEEYGYTREEAILLTINLKLGAKEASDRMNARLNQK